MHRLPARLLRSPTPRSLGPARKDRERALCCLYAWTGAVARGMHLFATSTANEVRALGQLPAIVDVQPEETGRPAAARAT